MDTGAPQWLWLLQASGCFRSEASSTKEHSVGNSARVTEALSQVPCNFHQVPCNFHQEPTIPGAVLVIVKQETRGREEKTAVTSMPSGQGSLGLQAGGRGSWQLLSHA